MKRKILVVSNDPAVSKELLDSLHDTYELSFAQTVPHAIDQLTADHVSLDLLLLDMRMPDADVQQLMMHLKQEALLLTLPVLALTRKNEVQDELRALSLGVYDYIATPFHVEILRHRLSKVSRLLDVKNLLAHTQMQAQRDPLTGLLNRRAMEVIVNKHFASSSPSSALFLMMDLDNFKNVNDQFGHDIGDKLLCLVSEAMKNFFRKHDVIARMGGDEFAVFLPHFLSLKDVHNRATRLCEQIGQIGMLYNVSGSIGISISPKDGDNYTTLYHNADRALLRAKNEGKNRFKMYEPL